MTESPEEQRRPQVVVHPVDVEHGDTPFRQVDILDQAVGHACDAADVVEFMRRAGLDTALVDAPGVVEWRGGGPDEWTWHTPV
ncbi:hypothetical protein [Streptacidiphilus neutrinimicus]|uniref:hypothetical protein n=1 Tax=Streptacidiphilus neutrinimicus TaxID=105420 RepID=UPI0005A97381|nr:hypothetical protein [Streptacidiphilus neutrinimicus]